MNDSKLIMAKLKHISPICVDNKHGCYFITPCSKFIICYYNDRDKFGIFNLIDAGMKESPERTSFANILSRLSKEYRNIILFNLDMFDDKYNGYG